MSARDGRPATGSFDVVDIHDTTAYLESASFVDGTATLRVPPGTYSVMGVINTLDSDDLFYLEQTMMGDPEIEITGDTTLTWDARDATEITVDTGDEAQVAQLLLAGGVIAERVAERRGGMDAEVGSLEPGKRADFAVIDAPDVNHWLYHFRPNACVRTVIGGETVWTA